MLPQRAAKAASLFGTDGLLARRSVARPRQSAIAAAERRQGAQARPSISAEDRRHRGPPSYTGAARAAHARALIHVRNEQNVPKGMFTE